MRLPILYITRIHYCRYRVTAHPDWTAAKVKQALWAGGIARSNKEPGKSATRGMEKWEDIVSRTRQTMLQYGSK